MTTNTTPTTEDHQDPQTHPDFRQRHNPNAWRDCSVPPTPSSDRSNPHFRSWRMHDNPTDALCWHNTRANGMLTFVHCALRQWSEQALKAALHNEGSLPTFEMDHTEVDGLIEILGAIGESLDLAKNAAAAIAESGNGN